jgi:hypothetical protein
MRYDRLIFSFFAIGLSILALANCRENTLRGSYIPSKDGNTYLIISDDNGGKCGPIIIDGKHWEHKINEEGQIAPGVHTIECGGEIQFKIPSGTVFSFAYWGP